MSSSPQRSETVDVDLSHEEQWVVHHVLVRRGDAALDDRETPAAWLIDLIERIEGGEHTLTDHQARQLAEELTEYADTAETPSSDVETADRVAMSIQSAVES